MVTVVYTQKGTGTGNGSGTEPRRVVRAPDGTAVTVTVLETVRFPDPGADENGDTDPCSRTDGDGNTDPAPAPTRQ